MLVGWEDEPTLLLRTFKKIFYLVLLKKNTMLFHADRMSSSLHTRSLVGCCGVCAPECTPSVSGCEFHVQIFMSAREPEPLRG